jgi:hypothetical protein
MTMDPQPVKIVGDNWFHTGWISGILGLPKPELSISDLMTAETFNEGYRMGVDTPNDLRSLFQEMLERGQIKVVA